MTNYFYYLIVFVCLIALTGCISSGEISSISITKSKPFPSLQGSDLNGYSKQLPESFDAPINIVAIGFLREHQKDIDQWVAALDKPISNPHVKFFELPVLSQMSTASRWWLNNAMRMGVPAIARPRTITIYTDQEKFLKIMDMNKEQAYLIILDRNHKEIWRSAGFLDAGAVKTINQTINQVLSNEKRRKH